MIRTQALAAPLALEGGGVLPGVRVAYETWGELSPAGDNAVLVLHALTGDSHVVGAADVEHPTAGWWGDVVGPGRAVDTDCWYVVAPNVLGGCRGTTGPARLDPGDHLWGSRFPRITVRDQVAAELALADALGIGRWAAVLGGSMGGMRALEWAVTAPERVGGLLVLATSAAASAEQIAWSAVQQLAITQDPAWRDGDYDRAGDGPRAGLGLARRVAHVTYRSEPELAERFGRAPQGAEDPSTGGRYAVQSYLDHQADKLVRRFDAGSYVTLTRAMDTHDVGRARGGVSFALARTGAALRARGVTPIVAAIDSDRLYPPAQQQELADGLGVRLDLLRSPYGHDGFLLETEQVGRLTARVLAGCAQVAAVG